MKHRPWPLVLLAMLQILSPVFTILFNAWAFHIDPLQVLGWLFERPWYDIFQTLIFMPIGGIAIFKMQRWSYPVFLFSILVSMIDNFRNLKYVSGTISPSFLIAVYVLDIILVAYFLLPSVRKTYFDPRVRWWESKPRYELKVPTQIKVNGIKNDSTILNISEGGAFLSTSVKLRMNDLVAVHFSILGQQFEIGGRICHERSVQGDERCYGVQFLHSRETQKRFSNLSEGLKLIGFQDRTEKLAWHKALVEGILTFLKTGRGWKPEIR